MLFFFQECSSASNGTTSGEAGCDTTNLKGNVNIMAADVGENSSDVSKSLQQSGKDVCEEIASTGSMNLVNGSGTSPAEVQKPKDNGDMVTEGAGDKNAACNKTENENVDRVNGEACKDTETYLRENTETESSVTIHETDKDDLENIAKSTESESGNNDIMNKGKELQTEILKEETGIKTSDVVKDIVDIDRCLENGPDNGKELDGQTVESKETQKMPIKEPDKESSIDVGKETVAEELTLEVASIDDVESQEINSEAVGEEQIQNEKSENTEENKLEDSDKNIEEKLNDRTDSIVNDTTPSETEQSKMDTSESSVGDHEAKDTQKSSVNEQSDSSGPPSLTKEVGSDDNSVFSETHRNEEMMDLNDEVPDISNENCNDKARGPDSQTEKNVTDDQGNDTAAKLNDKQTENVLDKVTTKTSDEFAANSATEKLTKLEGTQVVKSSGKCEMKQGQKLDQLLSKITQKAENEDKRAPRQAKARKSCAASTSSMSSSSSTSTVVSKSKSLAVLTFNIKELEKQGVLDIPKPSKRKAFEPVKIPSPEKIQAQGKTSPVCSPVRPSVTKKKLLKGHRRKKGKRMGAYRLPGEKNHKKTSKNRKTESEERETSKPEKTEELTNDLKKDVSKDANMELKSEACNQSSRQTDTSGDNEDLSKVSDKVDQSDSSAKAGQLNAFKMITKNAKRSFASTPITIYKKAKKTVKQGIDPATNRTLESFLMSGSHSQVVSPGSRKVC